ncbi:MAG: DUF5908 family protein [Chromatiales bacterium]
MTIEVKQLIIKSTVTNSRPIEERPAVSAIDLEQFREILLEECRELIATALNNMRER